MQRCPPRWNVAWKWLVALTDSPTRRTWTRLPVLAAAAAVLAAASIAVWQHRFSFGDRLLLTNSDFARQWSGWTVGQAENVRLAPGTSGGSAVILTKTSPGLALPFLAQELAGAGDVRFVHVKVRASCRGIQTDGPVWGRGRVVVTGQDDTGAARWDFPHAVCGLDGTRAAADYESVLELPPGLRRATLRIELHEVGELRVDSLDAHQALQRPAFLPAAWLLAASWVAFLAAIMGKWGIRAAWWRRTSAAGALAAGFYFLVFPQVNLPLSPFPTGSFAGGPLLGKAPSVAQTNLPPQPAASGANTATPGAPAPPGPAAEIPPPPSATTPPEPVSAAKQDERKANPFFHINRYAAGLHIGSFFALSLAVFILSGGRRAWPVLTLLAVLSEALPLWHFFHPDWDDLTDLLANLAGVLLAAAAWQGVMRLHPGRRPSRPTPANP
jgi:hypothetical protein